MIYIFEDNSDADISILYKSAYDRETIQKFVYAEGNGNIKGKVNYYLSTTAEQIVVFMDAIPGNKECYSIYRELSYISKVNNYRVVVLPIICAEYYMIKSICGSKFFTDEQEVLRCINKQPHILSDVMKDADKARFCKNFEKYCKYILKYTVTKNCLKPYNKINNANGEFYREDCCCDKSSEDCVNLSRTNKAANLLASYKYIPNNSKVGYTQSLMEHELWCVHRKLVNEYNEFVDRYKNADKNSLNKYRKFKYLK